MPLLLLGRADCHLCERLLEDLLSRFPEVPWQIEQADVDGREDWRRRWGLKVPVLLDERGEPLCVTELDVDAVRRWLADRAR